MSTASLLEAPPVAKKSQHGGPRPGAGRPKVSDRDDAVARMDREIVNQAQYIASRRGISIAAYLSDKLRASVLADFKTEVAKATAKTTGEN